MKRIFLRNDDIRGTLDESLLRLTDICIKLKVPIIHAVEPANVTKDVIDWLLAMKNAHSSLVEIIQHGYDHNVQGRYPKGFEFGGGRTYDDQYRDLINGFNLMNKYFGDDWTPVITFPFGKYNHQTLKVVRDIGYLGTSTSVDFSYKHVIKDNIGRLLKQEFLLGKKVSYHMNEWPDSEVMDIGVSVSMIKRYLSEERAIHFAKEDIVNKIIKYSRHTGVLGVLFHHRFHFDYFDMIEELLKDIASKENFSFTNFEGLLNDGKKS